MKRFFLISRLSIIIMGIFVSSCGIGQRTGPTATSTFTPSGTPVFAPKATSTPACAYDPDLPCFDGSYYELGYANPPVSWDKAAALASAKNINVCKSAHLATVTSVEEQTVVGTLINNINENVWLGGFQPDEELSLAGSWEWLTDEPFIYTNWASTNLCDQPGEPNDCPVGTYIPGSEQGLEMYPDLGLWNDAPKEEPKYYYLVEYDNCY